MQLFDNPLKLIKLMIPLLLYHQHLLTIKDLIHLNIYILKVKCEATAVTSTY